MPAQDNVSACSIAVNLSLEHTLMSLASYIVAVLALDSEPALDSAVAERSDGVFFGVVGHETVDY